MSKSSTSLNPNVKPESAGNARKALQATLQRRRIEGTVEETRLPHFFRVRRKIEGRPLVSIIIPFRDKPGLLRQCVTSVLDRSTYADFQVLGISNDSYMSTTYDEMERLGTLDERVAFEELNIEFNFSKLVNFGVAHAAGEHVILLNNDIEIITPDWIEGLLEHSQRPEVAVVGGKLYYSNNTIQHAGIAIGLGGYAGHLHKHVRADSPGYFNRLNVIQNVSALTGALMMVKKTKFNEIGMFDETSFGVAYNDVDFCLRARERGYLNVFTPHVEAYHHESVSRGYEDDFKKIRRFNREKENLRARHREALERGDPYYNPNLDPNRDDYRLPEQ
jgi:GT2 family glycosyltransferase